MDREYEWFDYQKVAEGQMSKLEPMVADIVKASAEFKTNLDKGSKAAKKAKEFLNLLYFTEKYPEGGETEGKKVLLGDYLADGKVDQQMLKKILVRMNTGSLMAFYTQLTLAVTDPDESWAERIEKSTTYKTEKPSSSQVKSWDASYYEYSMEILPKLQAFAQNYNKVGKSAASGSAADLIKNDSEEINSENIADVLKAGSDNSSGGIAYQAAYETMNNYTVGDEKLGDYILNLATADYSTRNDYRELYPLVEAFTNGQYAMCKMVGIEQLALYLGNNDETYSKMDSELDRIKKEISRVTKGEKNISVWVGVNTEFYERPVALTSDAYRESKAGADYTELTREGEFYDTMNLIMMGIGLASSVCAVITGVIQLGLLITGSSLSVWAACTAMIGTGFWASLVGVLGVVASIGGTVALIALLVALFVYAVYKIAEYIHRDDKGDYTEMPKEIYDIVDIKKGNQKQKSFTKYVPVTNSSGKSQDINGDDGKRWNLLYYSKTKGLGSPLCVDNEGKAFVRVTDKPNKPDGTVAVTCFGEKSAANLNSFVRKGDSKNIYLYYITTKSIKGTDGLINPEDEEDINEGEKAQADEKRQDQQKKYLYSLIISKESTESAAKTGIRRKPGYQVLDYNLTPNKEGENTPVYLYFLPSKAYTSGEKYISGIQVVAARKTKDTRGRDDLLKDLGLTDFGSELVSYRVMPPKDDLQIETDSPYGGLTPYHTHAYEDYTAHFAYSTTYIPYRAIYDLGIYGATTRIETLQAMMPTTEGVYASAETVMISDKSELYSESSYQHGQSVRISKNSNYYGRGEAVRVLPHHSWINPPHSRDRGYLQVFNSLNPEGNVLNIETLNYRLLGLYMVGPGNGREKPLKEGDIVVSGNAETPTGMHPAKLFTDPYADKPTNLGYQTDGEKSTPVYIYLTGEKKEKPKYISSVDVVTYKKPEPPKKDMSKDEEKMYKQQLKQSNDYADDQCRMGLISKVTGGVYNYNVAVDQSKTWYNTKYSEVDEASYIGVNRTDDPNKAITGIILYKSGSVTPHTIKVAGVEYRRTGDKIKDYNLYYTKALRQIRVYR